ncbi:hypothetical protein D6D01_09865 [Aureobasidium pullulans]|uniref:Uncharacterized protein n=1 Tax=Aureobasidium pullulans TaxID=5580 RepID=A0A4S9JUL9_AURPU|nr:hypothetical protein D6D01_09865 [Aureobasidium pullulans]
MRNFKRKVKEFCRAVRRRFQSNKQPREHAELDVDYSQMIPSHRTAAIAGQTPEGLEEAQEAEEVVLYHLPSSFTYHGTIPLERTDEVITYNQPPTGVAVPDGTPISPRWIKIAALNQNPRVKKLKIPQNRLHPGALRIPLNSAGLRDLSDYLQDAVYAPHIREVTFECDHIKSSQALAELVVLVPFLDQIAHILLIETRHRDIPIRDALLFVISGFTTSLRSGQHAYLLWNAKPERSRPVDMTAGCAVTDSGVTRPNGHQYEAHFDLGTRLGAPDQTPREGDVRFWVHRGVKAARGTRGRPRTRGNRRTEDEALMIRNLPRHQFHHLAGTEPNVEWILDFTRLSLRAIDLYGTRLTLEGLQFLLRRNAQTLKVLVLEQVDVASSGRT